MKKTLIILFTVFLSLFAFAGCNQQSAGEKNLKGEVGYFYSVNFSEKTLEVGETIQIHATYGNDKLSYQSSDTAVATVAENGLITAVGKGVAYITISAESAETDFLCAITVEQPVYSIAFEQEQSYEVFVGANKKLQVKFLCDGVAYEDTVTWSVNGEATLSVDGTTAMFTATAAGKYIVTVTSGKGATNTLVISVIDQVTLA